MVASLASIVLEWWPLNPAAIRAGGFEQAGQFLQPRQGYGGGKVLGGRPGDRVEMNAVRLQFARQADDFLNIFGHGIDARQQEDFQPQLAVKPVAEAFHSIDHCREGKLVVGAVDPLERLLVPGAQRHLDHPGQGGGLLHVRPVEQGAVGQQHRRNGLAAKMRQHMAEFGMKGGLAGSGQGQVVGVAIGFSASGRSRQ